MNDRSACILPPPDFHQHAELKTPADYQRLYQESLDQPEAFWTRMAKEHLKWEAPFSSAPISSVLSGGFPGADSVGPYVSWFSDGKLNASVNCLDRHVAAGLGEKPALIWRGEPENDCATNSHNSQRRVITYRALLEQVIHVAVGLEKLGLKAGDTAVIYTPMVPELVAAALACARIGVTHCIVFSAFSAEALASRISDCNATVLLTANFGFHGGKRVEILEKAKSAISRTPSIKNVVVFSRDGSEIPACNIAGVNFHPWAELCAQIPVKDHEVPAAFPAEHPLFILYTSGSTGKPKGVLHTTAGYLLTADLTFKYFFDYQPSDIFWCSADAGWITGHSYLIYGPLSNGATCVMYEGTPTYPEADRFWKIVAEEKVTIFYTAPTAIRNLMRLGEELPGRHDLSSLRLLGSVGEPINPEAWRWYYRVIGGERCPVIDTWWQTETGGVMISTIPGIHAMKPGSAGLPFFGVEPQIVDGKGAPVGCNESGALVIKRPWPGMIRGVTGDPSNALVRLNYFATYPGDYFTGDGARRDKDGYFWLQGRIDDVLNVSAHRLSTAELESALVEHPSVAEAAVVGFPHELKGQGIHCFVVTKLGIAKTAELERGLKDQVRKIIGPIATPDVIQLCDGLPKTRSGKIMRRILRKIAEGDISSIGDTSTLADPAVVEGLIRRTG